MKTISALATLGALAGAHADSRVTTTGSVGLFSDSSCTTVLGAGAAVLESFWLATAEPDMVCSSVVDGSFQRYEFEKCGADGVLKVQTCADNKCTTGGCTPFGTFTYDGALPLEDSCLKAGIVAGGNSMGDQYIKTDGLPASFYLCNPACATSSHGCCDGDDQTMAAEFGKTNCVGGATYTNMKEISDAWNSAVGAAAGMATGILVAVIVVPIVGIILLIVCIVCLCKQCNKGKVQA